jgi:hypothetical protein
MQTHFRAQARIARQALDAVALRHSVVCSFLSRRGRVLTEIAAQAEKRDLLLVSPRVGVTIIPSHEDLLRGLIGSAAAGLMALGDPRRIVWRGPVAVVLGTDQAKTASAIAIAGAVATKRGVPLCLFSVGQYDLPDSDIERIRALLSHPDDVRIGTLPAEGSIPALFSFGDPSLIVLSDGLPEQDRRHLLRHGTPVLLVR